MNNKGNTEVASGGIGFLGILGLIFIVLKLCHVIDWPWLWVLAPIWGSVVVSVLIFIIAVIILSSK